VYAIRGKPPRSAGTSTVTSTKHTTADLPGGPWVYDHDFFMIMNVAVGGQWPGNPDGTTTFPQEMRVDYVRVYDKS
jgi:beta-glucanase (GH16 family)